MSFEEIIAMIFQPEMFYVFALGMSLVFMTHFGGALLLCFLEVIFSLIHRFIWPGKKSDVTQSQDPGAGAAE